MPGGRPSTYSEKITSEIIERMSEGESLRSICNDKHMPNLSTVILWKTKHEEFSQQYEAAERCRAQHLFDELQEIADDKHKDTYIDENGNERTNTEVVARSRLRIDTRKWALSKMLPKLYGDKLDLSSSDGTMTPKDIKGFELLPLTKSKDENKG